MSRAPILIVKLQAEDDTKKGLTKAGKSISGTFKSIATAAAGFLARDVVNAMVSVGKESIKLGAKMETLERSFEAMKDPILDWDLSLENLRDAVQGTVSDVDLLTSANQALALGLPANELDDLFAAAQRVGAAMGRTTLEAVRDLTTGIGRQSRLILDNLGIIVDAESAYEEFAESIGKTTAELDASERKTAFMTAAIDSLNAKAAVLDDTISETQLAQERFAASWINIKTQIGTIVIPVLSDLFEMLGGLIDTVSGFVEMAKNQDWQGIADSFTDAFSNLDDVLTAVLTEIDWSQVFLSLTKFMVQLPFIMIKSFALLGIELAQVIENIGWAQVFDGILKAWGSFVQGFFEGLWNALPDFVRKFILGESSNAPRPPSTAPAPTPDIEAATGFRGIVSSPTTFLAGESGAESVSITPLSAAGMGAGSSGSTVIVNIRNFIGLDEESTKRQLANAVADIDVNELQRRGVR